MDGNYFLILTEKLKIAPIFFSRERIPLTRLSVGGGGGRERMGGEGVFKLVKYWNKTELLVFN